MNDATTPEPAFIGWRRTHPKSRWFAVASGETRAACWDALLLQLRGSGESMVIEAGRYPESKPKFRRGCR